MYESHEHKRYYPKSYQGLESFIQKVNQKKNDDEEDDDEHNARLLVLTKYKSNHPPSQVRLSLSNEEIENDLSLLSSMK